MTPGAPAIPMSRRRTLITGASSGIGRSIALALAAEGAAVHLVGRDRSRLEAAARQAEEVGGSARAHAVDLADENALEAFAADLRRQEDGLDALVHAAGAVSLGKVVEAPIRDLDLQYRVNVRVPYLLTQRLLPLLEDARGQIVFVNSGAGQHARPGWSQYAITKHGLRALADSLRDEVADRGVRVLSVYPGRTATPMQEEVHRLEGREYDPGRFLDPVDVAAQVVAALRLPARATVTDLSVRPTGL